MNELDLQLVLNLDEESALLNGEAQAPRAQQRRRRRR